MAYGPGFPSSERNRTRSTNSARVIRFTRPLGINEPPGFWSSIVATGTMRGRTGGLLEHDPLIVLVRDDPLEHLAERGEDDEGVIRLLDRLVGVEDRVDDVVGG